MHYSDRLRPYLPNYWGLFERNLMKRFQSERRRVLCERLMGSTGVVQMQSVGWLVDAIWGDGGIVCFVCMTVGCSDEEERPTRKRPPDEARMRRESCFSATESASTSAAKELWRDMDGCRDLNRSSLVARLGFDEDGGAGLRR